ncbi:hypothetical protein J7T55_014290 [Diaporthe amygdali]|uniref:uncharacterized protein n=1 Tax=Phomopsis amygdali TaxID=1214568 RepID=UPI0022FE7BD3|nr:uncharacterized protein J7T55_014290 [Diaporthe amygdali]KAJ0117841.1 hypothetical protein J7T55_014290 [Diaporthe amygdali]
MATASRTMSPGGSLLRASRMFSLPQAIPPPPGDFQAATSYNSDTATQAYPTLQTVTAPENFRQRGDWGFKRNFPMRSTARTSTPYLRIKQVDSIEHVTDFASAADHALTLEKWQEMNIAISLPHTIPQSATSTLRSMEVNAKSVFESKYDFTAIDEKKISESGQMRWKYKGPWLAKLTEGEFQKYIQKHVRPRKTEFRQFLREQLAAKLTQDAKLRASEEGGQEEAVRVQEVQPGDITEDQLTAFLRELRQDRQSLFDLVGKFLDLAPIEPPQTPNYLENLMVGQARTLDRDNPYALHGPPVTHPSAGLSYLRTTSYMDNHPAYGPLKYHPPVKGRVFLSSTDATSFGKSGNLGIGGFVVGSKGSNTEYRSSDRRLDPTVKGGQKLWAHIFSAQLTSQGRVMLGAEEVQGGATNESRMVQEEMVGKKQVFHKEAEDSTQDFMLPMRGPRSAARLDRRGRYVDPKITPGSGEKYGIKLGRSRGRDKPQ